MRGTNTMKKRGCTILLLMLGCTMALSGCRRKPVETEPATETQSETQTETKKETEVQTETAKQTQPQTEKKTVKQTEKKVTVTPTQPQTQAQTQPQTTAPQTEASAPAQCPYCGGWFSTAGQETGGTSEYRSHVDQEEAYIASLNGYDSSQYQTGNDGTQYAQCQYCFQWLSTTPDASGYSPYSEHVAIESAYAAQIGAEAEYYQCPNCGTWVTPAEYDVHIANGW